MFSKPEAMKFLAFFGLFFAASYGSNDHATDTFHIRHYNGNCLEWNSTNLVFKSVCRHHFRWKEGARLFHVPTDKCLVPQGNTDGSFFTLTSSCSGTDTLFQHMATSRNIKHLITGKCIAPESNAPPGAFKQIVVSSSCSSNEAKFWFVPQALYVIRHFSGLCWKYSASDNYIKLANTYVCDRFLQRNNLHLHHYETGKCVIHNGAYQYLRLSDDCTNSTTAYDLTRVDTLRQVALGRCVHPLEGALNPASGTLLVLHGCSDEDRIRTYFHEDRDILNIKIVSESGDDNPTNPRGHIIVNGFQHARNTRGINIVVLDYRSGILEHRAATAYDVYGVASHRTMLASVLNTLPPGKILLLAVQNIVNINSDLALALQKHGVSATFATTSIPKYKCSMAHVSFTGPGRKSWEKSVNQVNCVGKSEIQVQINVFHDFKGINDCSNEMGIRTGKLPDSRFTATSTWDATPNHATSAARLHMYIPGWCAVANAPLSHFIQVDLGSKKLLSGLAIQGHGHSRGYHGLSKYNLMYSLDGMNWQYYVDEAGKKKDFLGLQRLYLGETNVNWFTRILARFIRIMPVARLAGGTHCVRMELFGCSPKGPIFSENLYTSETEYILDSNVGEISFHGIAPLSKKILIGISTAESNTSLAHDADQMHLTRLNETTTINSGAIIENSANITYMKNDAKKLVKSAVVEYNLKDVDYYNLDIGIENKIVDSKRESGLKTWNTYTYETEDQSVIISYPLIIKRRSYDQSVLVYNIENATKSEYKDGDELNFNISISHWKDISYANAYKLELFIYYDTQFLKLNSFANIIKDEFTVSPTFNTTRPGFIHLQTDSLWLLNHHYIQFNFKFSFPNQIRRGEKCEGAILLDFAYQSNLEKFHGKFNTTLNKQIQYKCAIGDTELLTWVSGRMTVPGFSFLYDDVNDALYFCKRNPFDDRKNLQLCYYQRSSSISWHGMPHIASVVGIDTTKKVLFGLNKEGNGYVQSHNLQTFAFVEDTIWTSIQSQPHIRKAKTASDVTSLPNAVDAAWMLPSSSNQIWAATKTGLTKKVSGNWKYVIWW